MLERVLGNLRRAGVTEAVVNVHHLAGQIRDFLSSRDFGMKIAVSDESGRLLDTGGGLLKAAPLLTGDGPVVIHNADVVTDVDIRAMVHAHATRGDEATILVADRDSSRKLRFDDEMLLQGRAPADDANAYAFNCVHVVQPSVFEALARYATTDAFSITDFYVDGAVRVRGYVNPEPYQWFDIGTPQKLAEACASFEH